MKHPWGPRERSYTNGDTTFKLFPTATYRILDVNLRGVVHGVQAAYPIMLRQGFGHIVNMASGAGLWPSPFVVGYCTTKHAVVGLSTSLRIEAAAAGVRVSVLCPGAVRTPALTGEARYGKVLPPIPPEVLQKLVERQRPMRPERFAEQALRAVAKNRAIIVIPSWWRIVWWLNRLSPSLGFYLGRKSLEIVKRTVARLPPNQTRQPTGSASSISESVRQSGASPAAEFER